jgi:hypothetical protein
MHDGCPTACIDGAVARKVAFSVTPQQRLQLTTAAFADAARLPHWDLTAHRDR